MESSARYRWHSHRTIPSNIKGHFSILFSLYISALKRLCDILYIILIIKKNKIKKTLSPLHIETFQYILAAFIHTSISSWPLLVIQLIVRWWRWLRFCCSVFTPLHLLPIHIFQPPLCILLVITHMEIRYDNPCSCITYIDGVRSR